MLGLHLMLVTLQWLHHNLQLVLSKTIRIDDTKYHIQCSSIYWFMILCYHLFGDLLNHYGNKLTEYEYLLLLWHSQDIINCPTILQDLDSLWSQENWPN
jgi:hypothetical protein